MMRKFIPMLARIVVVLLVSGCSSSSQPQYNFLNDSSVLNYLSSFDGECVAVAGEPKLIPKYAVIDANTKSVDLSSQMLPIDQQARNSNELKTLVIVRSTSEQVGVYKSSGLPALRWTSKVIFIDVPTKQIFHEKSFLGAMPLEKRDLNSDASTAQGFMPTNQIYEYLKSLPRS